MFSRKKDALVRAIKTEIDVLDFFDFDKQEKAAGFGLSFTLVATLGGQFLGIGGWIDGVWKTTKFLGYRNTKKLIVPVALIAGAFGAYWLLADIPNAVPRKLAKKIRKELEAMDYIHGNSDRITKEVRKILRVPADDLRGGFQRVVEKRGKEREQLKEQKKESEVALKYFGNLYRKSTEISKGVNRLDLDNVPIAH
jgi:mitofusin